MLVKIGQVIFAPIVVEQVVFKADQGPSRGAEGLAAGFDGKNGNRHTVFNAQFGG